MLASPSGSATFGGGIVFGTLQGQLPWQTDDAVGVGVVPFDLAGFGEKCLNMAEDEALKLGIL